MHKIRVALPYLPLLLLLAAAPALAGDFRNADWGMSKEQVKASEWLPLQEEGTDEGLDWLAYEGILFGEPTLILYYFAGGKLVRVHCMYDAKDANRRRYLDYYTTFVECLTLGLGAPRVNETFYTTSRVRDNPDIWLTDPDAGGLVRYMYWDTAKTHALAWLSGRYQRTSASVTYYSIEFGYLDVKRETEELQTKNAHLREVEANIRKRQTELQAQGELGQPYIELFEDQLRLFTLQVQLQEERIAQQARAAP